MAYFLTELYKYRAISSSGGNVFLNVSEEIPECWYTSSKNMNFLYVSQSVCLLTSLPNLDKGISPVLDDISFWNFLESFLRCCYTSQIILIFMFVCQSFSCLTSFLKLGQNRDISCPTWDNFLKFFGDIPEMFVHFYQIITNFLYVCQSLSWITYLLKLGQYRDIACSGWDIFMKFFGDIHRMFIHYNQKI